MQPFIALVVMTGLVLTIGSRRGVRVPDALRVGLAAMFTMTGVVHFVGMRQEMIDMVPGALPAPGLLVTITGIAEICGALGLLNARTVLPAAAGLTALLVVMFPANVDLALNGTDLPWNEQLLPRTLLQVAFLAATTTVLRDRLRLRRQEAPSDTSTVAV